MKQNRPRSIQVFLPEAGAALRRWQQQAAWFYSDELKRRLAGLSDEQQAAVVQQAGFLIQQRYR